ncbi:Tropomyosin [Orchesella cincta]|uniref:Tropomyosin n=1 Tax=Orchesella cincta TaxID=48709 RepID=A0A1D2MPW3_ORCCI|nr:Tropomyosin [Orchesella cincta]
MQAMKVEKDNAQDKADNMEQAARDANLKVQRGEEELDNLKKRLSQLEQEYTTIQETLAKVNTNLEAKEKALTAVCNMRLRGRN